MKVDEFELAETVNALSQAIGVVVATSSPDASSAFADRMKTLIAASEPHSIRWRLYRQILRDATGEIADDSNAF